MWHELHSLKKGTLLIKSYVAKVKGLCAFLEASGSPISEAEQTEILLVGLPFDFDVVVSSAFLSLTLLPLQRIVDALLECERRQAWAVQEVVFAVNLVESSPSQTVKDSARGGRSYSRGCEKSFRSRL